MSTHTSRFWLSGWVCIVCLCTPWGAFAADASAASSLVSAAGQVTNTLGMRFVPIPGTATWISIWETRVKDYRVFCEATDHDFIEPDFAQTPDDPAVNVSWEDAEVFCRWLSGKERNSGQLSEKQKYRLPTDKEWSLAVGLGPETGTTPEQRMKTLVVWPWGYYWPPRAGDGNYGSALKIEAHSSTAPVGSFKPNALGIFDLGGNVWEWCDDWYNQAGVTRALRGASFNDDSPGYLLAGYRFSATMNLRNEDIGFRIVLDKPENASAR